MSVENAQVPVREILEQARRVCESLVPILKLPHTIARFAWRAITVRREFTARFSVGGNEETAASDSITSASNESHEFLTDVLQEALELLEEQ